MIALALVGAASPVAAQVVTREVKTADYEFSYAYPARQAGSQG